MPEDLTKEDMPGLRGPNLESKLLPDLNSQVPDGLENQNSQLLSSLHRFDLRSTPQLDVPLAADSATKNTYKQLLRYLPNSDFLDDNSSVGLSVPNTFKHKKHPNARTKTHIGMAPVEESKDAVDPTASHMDSESSIKGLRIEGNQGNSTKQNATPSWMPHVLSEDWHRNTNNSTEGKLNSLNNANLDFLGAPDGDTFIHNPQDSQEKPVTPMWKRMSKDYMLKSQAPLQNIFQSSEEPKPLSSDMHSFQSKSMSQLNAKTQNTSKNGLSYSSAFSTPIASKDGDVHLTQQQINQLEDILEQAKDKPDDYQIKGSPLKLFGSDYDTFTKVFLSKFVDKVRSTTNSAQRTTKDVLMLQASAPKLEIQKFTKAGDYTDQDFMKNANNVFAHLQQKGLKLNHIGKGIDDNTSFQRSIEHNTVTSTPKVDKLKDIDVIAPVEAYSSFSTDFGDSSSESHTHSHPKDSIDHQNEYTSFDRSQTSKSDGTEIKERPQTADDGSEYTVDDVSDDSTNDEASVPEDHTIEYNEPLSNAKVRSYQGSTKGKFHEPSNQFASSMSSVKRLPKESASSLDIMEKDFEFSDDDEERPIFWKRPSRLRLSRPRANSRVMLNSSVSNQITKGTVKPGKFPEQYGNMIYDGQNNRWVEKDKENEYPGSLDSILDLPTDSRVEQAEYLHNKESSILKLSRKPSTKDRNLEVSFQIPDKLTGSAFGEHSDMNVTKISDMTDVTFSETHKRLVSLITSQALSSDWKGITHINLSHNQLESVEGLSTYLPNVTKIDLSHNFVRYLKGLPRQCLGLNLSQNSLDNMTSFREFHDLQTLDILSNSFESLDLLVQNIHLTRLDASDNMIRSLDGLKKLSGLTYLNLSQNGLQGEIDFSKYDLSNLQELDLSENKIQSVVGIENLLNLRILNLNENNLSNLSCNLPHPHLKKLLVKFNRLRSFDAGRFPLLRVLRIDGNGFTNLKDIRKLKFLQEVSAKCQKSANIAEEIFHGSMDTISLDLSGNLVLADILEQNPPRNFPLIPFMNLNRLNLSATGLKVIPDTFADAFPNVRELNLNFNKLIDIKGLSNLKRLKSLTLLSNNIDLIEGVLKSLSGSRRCLKVIDMRLNSINFELYPYIFTPLERDAAIEEGLQRKTGPIQLEALDDIENFSIHYNSLIKSKEEWELRDEEFIQSLQRTGNNNRIGERIEYEAILINFFPRLIELDGGTVTGPKRTQMMERIQARKL